MELDYGTQLSPLPITLSIGKLIKPTLKKIADITFDKFGNYETFLKMTPEFFYTKILQNGQTVWDSLDDSQKESLTLYNIILSEQELKDIYTEIFNFFFEEKVVFQDNLFVLFDANAKDVSEDNIHGVISENNIPQVLYIIQQMCCIADKKENTKEVKFSSKLAEELYKKMEKARKEQEKRKKADINLTLPNIISSVSNRHPTINPINIWDLTVFQLIDSFNRMQMNAAYDIDSTRVSVWGDEKKTFNAALWYKNDYNNDK